MNIERKIRAFAGALVLVSIALGWWVHPAFYLVTIFVGLNLFQSAFSGFCPLEGILKRRQAGAARRS